MQEMWNNGWPLFLLGLWIGAPFGMLVMGLCIAARHGDTIYFDIETYEPIKHSKAFYDALDAVGKPKFAVVNNNMTQGEEKDAGQEY